MSDKMDIEKKEEKKNDNKESKDNKEKEKDEKSSDSTPKLIEYKPPQPTEVVVHPLVLLSVVDHYTRVAKDTNKRVVGVLLGENYKGKVDITNSYAVPFEEDPKDEKIWFLDAQYHQEMYAMFKKVNAKEKVVGWYSTGPKIRPADLEINELFRQYTPHPLLVIIDVNNQKNSLSASSDNNSEIPTDAYLSIEANAEEKSLIRRTFIHLPSHIGAYEAEEVGVEFLLRGVRDTLVSTLTDDIAGKINGLKGLRLRLNEIIKYLDLVIAGTIPLNHSILYNLQDIFNYLPDIRSHPSSIRSLTLHSNDNYLSLYLSSLIRSILALHDLLNNKILNREIEKDEQKKLDAEKKKRREEREKLAVADQEKKTKENNTDNNNNKNQQENNNNNSNSNNNNNRRGK